MFQGFRWQFIVLTLATIVFIAAAMVRLSRRAIQPSPAPPSPTQFLNDAATSEPPRQNQALETETTATARAENSISGPSSVYREALIGAVRRLNPLFAHLNPVDNDISSLIFEGIFTSNEYGEVVPRLAEELVISADGLEYVIRLRDDVRWQDGLPFSADDVVYTVSLLSDPAYARMSPAAQVWGTVELQKLGDHLLRFRLAQPLSSFTHLLTIGMLPEHALRGTTLSQLVQHPFNLSPIGTGPYQLAALRLGGQNEIRRVELARSPIYIERPEAQAKYPISSLQFHLYPDVEAALAAFASRDVMALGGGDARESLLASPSSQVYTQADSAVGMLIFNWQAPPFAERRARQALALSLDLPELLRRHLGADVTFADSPYPPSASVYLSQAFWHSYNPAQAASLLDAAGIIPSSEDEAPAGDSAAAEDAVNGAGFSLLVEDAAPLRNLAKAIAAQWEALGFQLQIEAVSPDDLTNRLETGRFQAAIVLQRIGGDLDLYRYWHPAQFGNGRNYGAASDHDLADLLEKARREIYSDRRAAHYRQFQVAFAEGAIAIPLYYPLYTFVVNEAIAGLQLGFLASPADRFRGIGDWQLEAQQSA